MSRNCHKQHSQVSQKIIFQYASTPTKGVIKIKVVDETKAIQTDTYNIMIMHIKNDFNVKSIALYEANASKNEGS